MSKGTAIAVWFASIVISGVPAQVTWYVDGSVPPSAPQNGSSSNPFRTITDAVQHASFGSTFQRDRVLVADGVYDETIDLQGKTLLIESVNGPATVQIRSFFARSGEGPSATLEGLTIGATAGPAGVPFSLPSHQTVLAPQATGADCVFACDLDGDGDLDVLSAWQTTDQIAWNENIGGGNFSSPQIIASGIDGAHGVHAADLDGDGDLDVLSASYLDHKISWHENLGTAGFAPRTVLHDGALGARSVHASDLDGDGDNDVIAASVDDNTVAWYENLGGGVFSAEQTITEQAHAAWDVHAADLDGDGDNDVLIAAWSDHRVFWHPNLGAGVFGPRQTISESAFGARSVDTTDLDGDGDLDVIIASELADKITWHENHVGTFGPERVITSDALLVSSIHATDIDGDGDQDVVAASWGDDTVAWHENLGGTFGAKHLISTNARCAIFTYAADLDGDGDPDVISANYHDGEIVVYDNRAAGAPACLIDGSSPTLARCVITDEPTGVRVEGNGAPSLDHCTLSGLTTAIDVLHGTVTVTDSIIWGNGVDIAGTGATVHSSCMSGLTGPGNLNTDPMFVDPTSHDFRLLPGSPCLFAASDGANMGAHVNGSAGSFALDILQASPGAVVEIATTNGPPSAPILILYSMDPLNGTAPGSGLFGGLHIQPLHAAEQISAAAHGSPNFGGLLDANGTRTHAIPPSVSASVTGQTWWGVATVFSAGTITVSNLATITIL